MVVKVNHAEILQQELERVAMVLCDATLEEYERAVSVVTEAVMGMPDVLPGWKPMIFRVPDSWWVK